jgi:hypothetical protein
VDKIPVAEGVKKWASEGAGKAYLPARGLGGSGTKPPTGAKPQPAGSKSAQLAQAKKDLASFFSGQGQS